MERHTRNSAKALIIRDGRMLAIRIRDGGDEWYILPGGGQQAGETLPEAARREVAEELGLIVEPKELALVVEGSRGEAFHRVDLVFVCEYIGEIPNAALHPDTNQAGVEWLDIGNLIGEPLYPSRLRRAIMRLYYGEPHPIYLGNECVGDPEFLD